MENNELAIEGFLLVDKPRNLNSHELSSYIARLLGIKKAGHSGTLDPEVSGLMIIALGRATKMLRFLSRLRKEYIGVVEFKERKSKEDIEKLFSRFVGEIRQMPPKESAVAKKWRKRRVYSLKLLETKERKGKTLALFSSSVEAGTYIRVLCKDMGGRMVDLRRIKVGSFRVEESYIVQEIEEAGYLYKQGYPQKLYSMMISYEEMIKRLNYKEVLISKTTAKNVFNGSPIYKKGIIGDTGIKEGDIVSVWEGERLIGMGRVEKEKIKMLRVIKRE